MKRLTVITLTIWVLLGLAFFQEALAYEEGEVSLQWWTPLEGPAGVFHLRVVGAEGDLRAEVDPQHRYNLLYMGGGPALKTNSFRLWGELGIGAFMVSELSLVGQLAARYDDGYIIAGLEGEFNRNTDDGPADSRYVLDGHIGYAFPPHHKGQFYVAAVMQLFGRSGPRRLSYVYSEQTLQRSINDAIDDQEEGDLARYPVTAIGNNQFMLGGRFGFIAPNRRGHRGAGIHVDIGWLTSLDDGYIADRALDWRTEMEHVSKEREDPTYKRPSDTLFFKATVPFDVTNTK